LSNTVNFSKAIIQWFKSGDPVIGTDLSYTYSPDFNSSGQ